MKEIQKGFNIVYEVNGKQAIKLSSFAKIVNYSDTYLLEVIKNLFKKSIYIAYKWKRNYYVFLPQKPRIQSDGSKTIPLDTVETPSGDELTIDWEAALNYLPSATDRIFTLQNNFIVWRETLYIVSSSHAAHSSTLVPKNAFEFVPLNLGKFPATTDYKYGYYISYDPNKMSTFDPGTSGTLKSTQIPQAFFEVCRALDAAENSRNGANPGLTPRRNLSTTVSFDTGTVAVAATIPIGTSIQSDGTIKIVASDYLGGSYSAFDNGDGDLTSSNIVAAFLETASLLSAAEKAVTPIENQPNNVQIQVDIEAGNATVSANLPFTTLAATNGDVTVHAIDYL
ncbi:hypothetical protein FACHB389_35920 [Nostoc calcicola FACHB-389]|nr:hypothetical protein [Nostoc calcicola FACHB-3891]OKH14609.1 hypothetical protein FACHB389_35920 [Nostoc calcicola FACHB-389]